MGQGDVHIIAGVADHDHVTDVEINGTDSGCDGVERLGVRDDGDCALANACDVDDVGVFLDLEGGGGEDVDLERVDFGEALPSE